MNIFLTLHAAGTNAPVTINMDKVAMIWQTDGGARLEWETTAGIDDLIVTETRETIADRLRYARQTAMLS